MPFDKDVFGSTESLGYDPEVFSVAKPAKKVSARERVENDEITKGAKEFAKPDSAVLNIVGGLVRGAGSIGSSIVDALGSTRDAVTEAVPENLRPAVTKEQGPRGQELRTSMDRSLREMGADPESLTFRGAQVGAEIAGTLGVGGALAKPLQAAAAAGGRAAPALQTAATAIESGGFRTGAQMGRGADIATRMAGGAVAGGAAAGMVNPEDAATGAAIGAVLPPALKGAGAALDAAGRGARAVAATVSDKAARSVAVDKVAGALGDDAAQAAADIGTYFPKGAEDIPLSAAAITRNPNLAQLEQGSRLRNAASWFDFDQKQGRAVFDNVLKATDEAGDLPARYTQRQDNWRTLWATTSQSLKPRVWMARMTQFGADMEMALRSPDASNPAVRGVLDAVNAEMDRIGPSFSPAHLQQLRANLNGKVQPLSPDVFKSAPRDSPAIKSLIAEMDDILNASTGGKWQKVLENYAKDSDLVRQAKAAQRVREAFVDASGNLQKAALDPLGDVPRVTEAGLRGAMNATRNPANGELALSAEAQGRLGATMDTLQRQGIVQQLKKAATAGGGSDTVPNAIAAGATAAGAPGFVTSLLQSARRMGTAKTDQELAALLSNPDELAKALQPWLARPAAGALPGPGMSGAARALPVLGAGAFAAPAGAQPGNVEATSEFPQPTPAPAPLGPTSAAPSALESLAAIGSATSIDQAIAAAGAAVDAIPEPSPAVAEMQAPPEPVVIAEAPPEPPATALIDSDVAAPPDGRQPIAIWTGRRGSGYLTPEDALVALPTREKREPGLVWRVERMQSGAYRLGGYAPPESDGGLMEEAEPQQPTLAEAAPAEAAQPAAVEPGGFRLTMNQTGTARLQGDPAELQPVLEQLGITNLVRMPDGFLIGRSQAEQARQAFA
jgi:hypothetical protein